MLAEAAWPRRSQVLGRWRRWPANLGMAALNALVVRLLAPGAVIGAALWAGEAGVGLFNLLPLPGWLVVVASVLLLDLTIFGQHVAFHRIARLWRLTRIASADTQIEL